MKYSIDKAQVRELLRVMDISHTINGGVSEPRVRIKRNSDHLSVHVITPGIKVEDLHVRLVDQHIVVSHDVTINDVEIPRIITSVPLEVSMEYRQIFAEATERGILIKVPFNDLNRGLRKEIPVVR